MEQALIAAAQKVFENLENRAYDRHRTGGDGLAHALLCHEILAAEPSLAERLWVDYEPWPNESRESVDLWIDAEGGPTALEVHVGGLDPASPAESRPVRSELVADVLKLATAVRYCDLTHGYVLLFAHPSYLPVGTPMGDLAHGEVGATIRVRASELHPHESSMDRADYEALMHPRELSPVNLDLTLRGQASGTRAGYWLWSVSPPPS